MKLVGGGFPLLEKIVIVTTHYKYFFSLSIENKVMINYRRKVCKIVLCVNRWLGPKARAENYMFLDIYYFDD